MAAQPGLCWDLVGNAEGRFSGDTAQIVLSTLASFDSPSIRLLAQDRNKNNWL